MPRLNTRDAAIEEALTRSVAAIYPDRSALRSALRSGRKLTIYVGIDPTAPYVHIGHSTNYLVLERFQKLGHRIVVLVGDFTAMIGDPSDKKSARQPLTRDEVRHNLATFKEQIGKVLDFKNAENPVAFKFNSEWLSKLTFEDVIGLASNFTVQQMLERDMFEKRIAEGKPLFVHEFFYPLMQGYDSVAMDVDLEIGGTDQTFNMLAGRTLVERYKQREKFVLTTTLLVNPATGEKMMSKSLGTGIGLNEPPAEMFGKTMALPDEGIIQTFIDCTRLSLPEIDAKRRRLVDGENPKTLKLELAHELVRMYHGAAAATAARAGWEAAFSERRIPDSLPQIKVKKGSPLIDTIVANGFAPSKTAARRLFTDGAIHNLETDKRINDPTATVNAPLVLKIGKKHFVRIVV